MRVTNNMLIQNITNNIHKNLRDLERSQEKLSTGKRLHNPSDDPAGVVEALGLRTQETEMNKYIDNVSTTKDWLESTDSALGETTDVIQRLRELTTYGASDSLHDEARKGLAEEVKELKDHLVQVANSDIGGKHLFGGHNTLEKPFERVENDNDNDIFDVEYWGNEGKMAPEINVGVDTVKNLTGTEVFGNPNTVGKDVVGEGEEIKFDNDNNGNPQLSVGAIEVSHEEHEEVEEMKELEVRELDEIQKVGENENALNARYALVRPNEENGEEEVVALSENAKNYQVLDKEQDLEIDENNSLVISNSDNNENEFEDVTFANYSIDFSTRVTSGMVEVGPAEVENSDPAVNSVDNGEEIELDDNNNKLGAVDPDASYLVKEYENENNDGPPDVNGVTANYYWESDNDNDNIVAISEDGNNWYALEVAVDDLNDDNDVSLQGSEDNEDDRVIFQFDESITSGYVNVEEEDDRVTATAYDGVEFKSAEYYQEPDSENSMFHAIDGLYDALMEGDTEKLSNEVLGDIDHWLKQTQDNRSVVGPRINRMELTENRLKDIDHINKERLSEVEEADMAETIMNLKMEENVHRMALNAGARVIQPTLLDFLQ